MDGTVLIRARVDPQGAVIETEVVKSIPMLDAAARTAVEQWTFSPPRLHGRPVQGWTTVPVKFSLH